MAENERREVILGADSGEQARAILRRGRSVRLEPIGSDAHDFLYDFAIDEAVGWRWRHAGAVPRREVFEQSLWNGVLTQFVIVENASDTRIGMAVAYNADLNHGFAYVAAGVLGEAVGSGVAVEAIDMFVGHLFGCYRLRKLYFEVPEYNLEQFSSAIGSLLAPEALFSEHTYYNGRYWDRHVLTLDREVYAGIAGSSRVLGRQRRVR